MYTLQFVVKYKLSALLADLSTLSFYSNRKLRIQLKIGRFDIVNSFSYFHCVCRNGETFYQSRYFCYWLILTMLSFMQHWNDDIYTSGPKSAINIVSDVSFTLVCWSLTSLFSTNTAISETSQFHVKRLQLSWFGKISGNFWLHFHYSKFWHHHSIWWYRFPKRQIF